jgi:hypothetical protein
VVAFALVVTRNIPDFSSASSRGANDFPNISLVAREGETVSFFDIC